MFARFSGFAPSFALLAFVVACGSSGGADSGNPSSNGGSTSAAPGNQGGPCYPNSTCNSGLTCASNICVRLGGTGGAPNQAGAGGAPPAAGGSPPGAGGFTPSTGGFAPATGAAPAVGAPVVLSLTASPPSIWGTAFNGPTSSTITAILTDPDGAADIVGGTLKSANGALAYGPFASQSTPGTYTIAVSFTSLDALAPVPDFDKTGSITLLAEFFDQSGHKVDTTFALGLTCPEWACGGNCVDVASDPLNCSACKHACFKSSSSSTATCFNSVCQPDGTLVDINTQRTCAAACASLGGVCAENGCSFDSPTSKYTAWSYKNITGGVTEEIHANPCSYDYVTNPPKPFDGFECCCGTP